MTAAFLVLVILMIAFRTLEFLGFIVVIFLMGILLQSFDITLLDKNEKSIANIMVLGFLFVVAIAQVVLIPLVLYMVKVSTATIVLWIVFLVLSIISVIRLHNEIGLLLSSIPTNIKNYFAKKKCGGVYGFVAFFLIVIQLLGSLFLYHYDDDDAIYVTTVASNIADNSFLQRYGPTGEDAGLWDLSQYLTNGWYDFLTVVCKTTGIPAAVLMHTVLPVLLIALAYSGFYLFSKVLIQSESKRYLFMIFVSIINILNNVSTHTSSSVLLMRIHQGKALFANIIVPVMFCVFLEMWEKSEYKTYLWVLLIANISACAFSTTGLVFGAMLTAIFAVVFAISKKNLKGGLFTLLAIVPNLIFATIYVCERLFEVWGC